jgi:hypothetical protein
MRLRDRVEGYGSNFERLRGEFLGDAKMKKMKTLLRDFLKVGATMAGAASDGSAFAGRKMTYHEEGET